MRKLYRILAVDDEPAALKHICDIIEKKSEVFEIVATAENGAAALQKIQECQPDVLITDIKMPIMDGITLVTKVRETSPQIISIIVSGYQDFEYAREAIRSGVADYILKPVRPENLKQMLTKLEEKLSVMYAERRNNILRELCNTFSLTDNKSLSRVFPGERYFIALVRANALPQRFGVKAGIEVFAMKGEMIYIYGRDEREALFVCPAELYRTVNIQDVIERYVSGMNPTCSFYTAVICDEEQTLETLPQSIKTLYRRLEKGIRIGETQLMKHNGSVDERAESSHSFDYIDDLLKNKKQAQLGIEIKMLFNAWEKEKRPQLWVESQLRYMTFGLQKHGYLRETVENCGFMLDDAISGASSMAELCDSYLEIIEHGSSGTTTNAPPENSMLYETIIKHINLHMSENLSIQTICKQFGVSKTTLCRLFRIYGDCSFGVYITNSRISKAKQLMDANRELYVKDVAEWVGYKDQFYFSRIFRAITGMTPSEYLEDHK